MKSIISLILLVANFLIFHQASNIDPSSQYYHPPKPLHEVVENLPEGYGIVSLTSVDEDSRSAQVVFPQPLTESNEILNSEPSENLLIQQVVLRKI